MPSVAFPTVALQVADGWPRRVVVVDVVAVVVPARAADELLGNVGHSHLTGYEDGAGRHVSDAQRIAT